jgi:aspartyl-tRNA(Asn)/glutamyl-tRNA(Gln) amidotransferase subunit A
MTLSQLNHMTAGDLARAMAAREVSPIEAVGAALERIEQTEPRLNAFIQVDPDGALAAARRAEAEIVSGTPLGPLHGVPISVKDLIDVGGLRATYGSLTLKDAIAPADAPSVERIKAAGAIVIGKTTTSEFGYRGYTRSLVHGNTRNPWDLGRTPGGSSGGAVASVAAGVSAVALGTDGGGSIRAPSSLTGVVGIKANFGRVPVWPASATPTLAHVGPIARTVADAALLLSVCAGPHAGDPFSFIAASDDALSPDDTRRLRVAFSPTLGYARVESPVAAVVAEAVRKLQIVFPNIELVEKICDDEGETLAAEFIGGCSARLGNVPDQSPELIDPPLLAAIRGFRATSVDSYTRLLRRRLQHRETLRRFSERYDLLLTPTTPCLAWDIERGLPPGHENAIVWSYFTYPFNLTGQPAGSLPCGLSPEGLPIGLQFVVPLCREDRLVGAMLAAEAALGSPCPLPIDPGAERLVAVVSSN